MHLLAGPKEGGFPRCHGVVIKGRETVLIDTGGGREVLLPWAEPGRVDLVLNTHTHPDHSSCNHLFAGTEIWVPAEGFATSGRRELLAPRFTEPALADTWLSLVPPAMDFSADQPPTRAFAHGQELTLAGVRVVPLHTPGHTIDHYCLWLPELKLLISGDLDLTPFGPWYGHHESSLAAMRASIETARALPAEVVVSMHRAPVDRDIYQAWQAFTQVLDERRERILGLLDAERGLAELVDASPIYGGFPFWEPLLRFWEGCMIAEHLAELRELGLARQTEAGWRVA